MANIAASVRQPTMYMLGRLSNYVHIVQQAIRSLATLDHAVPELLCYSRESAIAERLQTMVTLGSCLITQWELGISQQMAVGKNCRHNNDKGLA